MTDNNVNDLGAPHFATRDEWGMLGDEGARIDVDDWWYNGIRIADMFDRFDVARAAVQGAGEHFGVRTFVNLSGDHLNTMISRHPDMRPQNILRVKGLGILQLPASIETMSFHEEFRDSIRGYTHWPAHLKLLIFHSMSQQDRTLDRDYIFPPDLERVHFPILDEHFSLATGPGFAWPDRIVEMSLRVDRQSIRTSLSNANMWPRLLETLRLTVAIHETTVEGFDHLAELAELPATPAMVRQPLDGNITEISQCLAMLPATLHTLYFHSYMLDMMSVRWPDSVTKLILQGHSGAFVPDARTWPASLTDLDMERFQSDPFRPSTEDVDPFGAGGVDTHRFMASVVWPPNLQRLVLPNVLEIPLVGCIWPETLRHLVVSDRFNEEIFSQGCPIPETLLTLTIPLGFDDPLAAIAQPTTRVIYAEAVDAERDEVDETYSPNGVVYYHGGT